MGGAMAVASSKLAGRTGGRALPAVVLTLGGSLVRHCCADLLPPEDLLENRW